MAQVAAVVGPGGQYTRQVFNFRRQRVREEWPVNGLVTDYWVDTNGALLVEAGAASLTAQYPRPVWEYVYVGGQPVARVDSTEAEGGTTSHQGLAFLFGGHLGELLLEADPAGHVVRSYDYTAFGARQARPPSPQPVGITLSSNGLSGWQVSLPAPASVKLRFENFSLASCDSVAVFDEENHLLTRLSSSNPLSFETEALPAQGGALTVMLQQGSSCSENSSLTLAEVKPSWGRAQQTVITGHEYSNPPVGFFVSLSLPSNTHLLVERAFCDTLEVRRTGTGDVLWTSPAAPGYRVWTPALSGDVEVGIASTSGCGGFPRVFALRRMYTPLAPGAPANLHRPGQRALTAATSTRLGPFGDPEPTLLENWHRSYDPSIGRYLQPEPVLAVTPSTLPAYAYALNNPVRFVDPTGWEPDAFLATHEAMKDCLQVPSLCSPESFEDNVAGYQRGAMYAAGGQAALIAGAATRVAVPLMCAAAKKALNKLNFDGPSKGAAHMNGRLFGIRYNSQPVIRLDLHPMKGKGDYPILHFTYLIRQKYAR